METHAMLAATVFFARHERHERQLRNARAVHGRSCASPILADCDALPTGDGPTADAPAVQGMEHATTV